MLAKAFGREMRIGKHDPVLTIVNSVFSDSFSLPSPSPAGWLEAATLYDRIQKINKKSAEGECYEIRALTPRLQHLLGKTHDSNKGGGLSLFVITTTYKR